MNKLSEFLTYLQEQVDTKSIYVWGGQGEKGSKITENWIKRMENSTANANRAIALWKRQVAAGYGAKLSAFDCSGLAVYFLLKNGLLKSDTTANGLRGYCDKLTKGDLRKGDWVFRVTNGNAYHIGYVVDDNLNVVEAKGRDDGVVKRGINANGSSYWNAFGRPTRFFGNDLQPVKTPTETPSTKPPITTDTKNLGRVLKRMSPYIKGTDVQQAQRFLQAAGYSVGSTGADGVFGSGTEQAVKQYQKAKGLTQDGKIGKNTWESWGGKWTGN